MGQCQSTEEQKRSAELTQSIKRDFNKQKNIVKLLLLGTGESGKSTIVKQMKIIHGSHGSEQAGLTDEERKAQIDPVRNNVLDSIEALITAAEEFDYPLKDPEAEAAKSRILQVLNGIDRAQQYNEEVAKLVTLLWENAAIQKCVARKNDFQLLDSAPYFLSQADRLSAASYVPTDEDVLRARTITTGIVTVPFKVKDSGGFNFELIDVGGQRTERRKWIHVFQDVTAVMFIISLSDYNQTLYEDETTNRMQESEKLFGQMLDNVYFRETPFIVFFNKVDLFEEKLKTHSLTIAYREYTGTQEPKEAFEFIKTKFLSKNHTRGRGMYTYPVTATDTGMVDRVMKMVRDIIVKQILKDVGMLN